MLKSIDLSGVWRFQLDKEKKGSDNPCPILFICREQLLIIKKAKKTKSTKLRI
jgi:hypothetical protein